ncbi:MAG: hypothetical protein HY289_01025 [Planctomycetes bacterium]|nr:hypothetical protein [Planctomycetota bacterium]
MHPNDPQRYQEFINGDWKELQKARPVDMAYTIWYDVCHNPDPRGFEHAMKWAAVSNLKLQETASQIWWFALIAAIGTLAQVAIALLPYFRIKP